MNTYRDNTPNRKINVFQYDAKTIIPLGFFINTRHPNNSYYIETKRKEQKGRGDKGNT
jgi:hypothetical protein